MKDAQATIHVGLAERSYDIDIGRDLLGTAAQRIARHVSLKHAVLITDENVAGPHATAVREHFESARIATSLLTVPAGERSKCIQQAHQLWDQVLAAGAHRETVVVAIGGGVVGDLAGFVAATFARGIPLVQIPTSLLAQVDSSVGGKVGINLTGAKNMVGAFWQPRYVLIDTDVLATLPDREFRAGLAEVVKYGVILDAEFFAYLESHADRIQGREPDVLRTIIARCCALKAEVVTADEREQTGLRAVLNYGHTLGHALEAITGYGTLLHGEAISIGMLCASRLAVALGRIPAELTTRQEKLLRQLQLPTEVPAELDLDAVLRATQHDKKVQDGRLRYILPTRLGHVELVADVDPALVRHVLGP